MFRKVLIANRGEIARRILRTCRDLGIATVAVYSDADADAPHVVEADEAVHLGPTPAADSYLAIDRLVGAARRTGADAVHPGYGFLAENAAFARAVTEAGLTFVGPRPETIALMGDKAAAKAHLRDAGVPVVPGLDEVDGDVAGEVGAIGYPVLVKAVAGGGGKGMRRVDRPEELTEAIAGARREAEKAFGDGRVLVEKLVEGPRHVEFQVVGDRAGTVIHLFERECSIQRRHQKVVEETPSPALDADLRHRMGEAAVTSARSVGYEGAGTVEMLLSDVTGDFYFLEMNTRLQVEHPVTELVTGVDLVAWQFEIAAGGKVPLTQDEVRQDGHAIEVRVYAEDPAHDHLPQTGTVRVFDVPAAPDVRVDSGVEPGSEVVTAYDPMLAKLIVHAASRDETVARMAWVLRHTAVLGVTTNLDHLLDVVSHPAFAAGELTTSFLDDHLPDWTPRPTPPDAVAAATAALLHARTGVGRPAASDPWDTLGPWRLASVGGWHLRLRDAADVTQDLEVTGRGARFTVAADDGSIEVAVRSHEGPVLELEVDGRDVSAHVAVATRDDRGSDVGDVVWVHTDGATSRLAVLHATRHADPGALAGHRAFVAPMPGSVAVVNVAVGDHVAEGDLLVVVEAMKMEHPIRAMRAGTVTALHVGEGDPVDADQPLVEIDPDDGDDED